MNTTIPDTHMRLLEEPVLANLATLLPDGQPQVHPVWCNYDGEHLMVNTFVGSQKDENLKERERATVLLRDPENPYFWIEIRGRVAKRVTGEEAKNHIDTLAYKYLGAEEYPQDEERVMYKIEPERILSYGD